MKETRVSTQAQFDAALNAGDCAICVSGKFSLMTGGNWSPRIVLCAQASLHVVARGRSQPHVEARESSQPHVVARESSQPHVVARGRSQPHVEASGCVQLSAVGKVLGKAAKNVAVLIRGAAKITGGKQTKIKLADAKDWCDYYGVPLRRGVATLYKAVNDDFSSPRGGIYTPGTVPSAPDWDGGKKECGGGFHFSPSPRMALEFHPSATRFVACPVALSDMRAPEENDQYPQKIKAAKCCKPVFQVDRYDVAEARRL